MLETLYKFACVKMLIDFANIMVRFYASYDTMSVVHINETEAVLSTVRELLRELCIDPFKTREGASHDNR